MRGICFPLDRDVTVEVIKLAFTLALWFCRPHGVAPVPAPHSVPCLHVCPVVVTHSNGLGQVTRVSNPLD